MPTTSYRPALLAASAAAALFAAALPCPAAFAQASEPAKEYDVKAEALLQRAADRLKAAQTYSGQVLTTTKVPAAGTRPALEIRSVRTFRLQKPNLVFQELGTQKKGTDDKWMTTPAAKYISNGKTGASLSVAGKTYRTLGVTPDALGQSYNLNFPEFFNPKLSDAQQARDNKASGDLYSLRMAPDETFGGVACAVVEEKSVAGKTKTGTATYATTKIYVGKKDDVIRGYHTESPSQSGDGTLQTSDDVVTNVVVGDKIPISIFAVNLTGYKEFVAPQRPVLLAAGMPAPDFTAYDKDGKAVKLSDLKGKIVVLDFWATWCGPCMRSLPHTTDVAKKTADKGVVVLAVNVWDKKEEFDKWLPQHPEFSPLTFVIDTTPGQGQDVATKLYKVSGIPTQYIIDRNGKIVTSFVGFGGPTEDLENAIAKADAAGTAVAQK